MTEIHRPARPNLLSNSRWNLIAFAFTIGAHFMIVPFVVGTIGLDAFGHAGLVIAAWAPMLLVGTVIGQATTREVAARWAAGEVAAARALTASAMALCAAGCVVAGTLFVWVGPYLLDALSRERHELSAWRNDLVTFAPGWVAQQFALVLQATAAARQDFRTVAHISSLSAVATVAITIAATQWIPTAQGFLVGTSASFVLTALVSAVFARHAARGLFTSLRWQRDATSALLRFGKWQAVAQLAGTFGNQVDRYALAALASPAVIGQFNAANRLQEAAYAGVVKAAEVLLPRFGADAHAPPDQRSRLFLLVSTAVMLFSAVLLTPMVVLSEPLMRLWAGAAAADGGALLLCTLVLGGLIGCGSSVMTLYFMGLGQNAPVAALSIVYSVLTILLTIATLRTFGPLAAGSGLALASVVRVALALVWGRRRAFPDMRWTELLVSTVLPLAVALGVAAAARWLLPVERIEHWGVLVVAYGGAMLLVALAIAAAMLASSFGRSALQQLGRVGA